MNGKWTQTHQTLNMGCERMCVGERERERLKLKVWRTFDSIGLVHLLLIELDMSISHSSKRRSMSSAKKKNKEKSEIKRKEIKLKRKRNYPTIQCVSNGSSQFGYGCINSSISIYDFLVFNLQILISQLIFNREINIQMTTTIKLKRKTEIKSEIKR